MSQGVKEIRSPYVCFISRNFGHLESTFGRLIEQRFKPKAVISELRLYINGFSILLRIRL